MKYLIFIFALLGCSLKGEPHPNEVSLISCDNSQCVQLIKTHDKDTCNSLIKQLRVGYPKGTFSCGKVYSEEYKCK